MFVVHREAMLGSVSPFGTGDFAVNAGFAALTLGPADDAAGGFASPLTPAERRSVVAALSLQDEGRSSLDGETNETSTADDFSSPAFSPTLAAVVAKAVAGKILTLSEKGALQTAMEVQDKRRRARARRANYENKDSTTQQFSFPSAVSPYDPRTSTGCHEDGNKPFRFPAMTDDNTPSTGRSCLLNISGNGNGCVLTPLSNASSVPSLPSDSSFKSDIEKNPVRRAMAKAARGEKLTPNSQSTVDAVSALRDGKIVSKERLEMLEKAERGGFGSTGAGKENTTATTTSLGGFGSPVANVVSGVRKSGDTPTMNLIYAKSDRGEKLTDDEEEVLRRYLMTTPPAVPSAVARRHRQRRGKSEEESP